ncbi:hypothetical protein [Kitasatospora sp. NPDC094016]|uniref:effector-associated constant component EACC1 n=1 Tax=Kitasatospora sp. NPDC094016 TaxID=3154986 RepID=UPI003332CABA
MTVLIGVETNSNDIDELTGLADWLRSERGLGGSVELVPGKVGEHALGGAIDLLSVALGSGGAGAVLAQSVSTWLQTRRSDVKISIESEGRKIEIQGSRVRSREIDAAASTIRDFLNGASNGDG